MPLPFIPKKSGAHRIACIALYRALLSQCSRLEVPSESFRGPINPIKFLIRKQFRRNKHETSPAYIISALKVGYESVELLRNAGDGDKDAFSKALSLLREVQSQGDADRTRVALNTVPRKPQICKVAPYPNAPKVLESRPRPFSELTGPRHIPILTATNGLPFLRFKKPQSPFMSRILRNKLDQNQRRWDNIDKLEADMLWAADEDEWERLIGGKDASDHEPSFKDEIVVARLEIQDRLDIAQERSFELGRKMLKIIDEEKALFEEERIQRQKEKSRERQEKKERRRSSNASNEPSSSGESVAEPKAMASCP